ncbi:hypothetical protein DRQ33_04185 [bacterium]|nr:MAG: hypothetical protein DRQ33_04185 [bacterium]
MIYRFGIITIIVSALFFGCVGTEKKDEYEEKYAQFVKKREKQKYGVEIETLKEALKYYPQFKKFGPKGNVDIIGFRQQVARQDSMDCSKFFPVFFIIMEIEDSLKTESGRKYLDKKYNPKVVAYVKGQLKIKTE